MTAIDFYILGHSDVAWRRKIDPGELFDWKRLSDAGIGCWPQRNFQQEYLQLDVSVNADKFIANLKRYGYDTEIREDDIATLISAFQRHFRQNNIDGILDSETMWCLDSILKQKFN